MSDETVKAIEDAIAAHVKESVGDDRVVGAWVVGWEASHLHDINGQMRVCFQTGYAIPDTSPMATLGIATALPDLMFGDEDDDEGDPS